MLDADTITARRRLKRSLLVWRIVAIGVVAIGLIGLGLAAAGPGFGKFSDHVARIKVEGLITGKRETLDLMTRLGKSQRVKAVIIHIDSPGGTTAGSEALYESIRELAGKKPVVAVMGSIATSGGYITAIATDHIVARGNTITGSIGVIFQWSELHQLLERLGIKVQEVKSGDLKAQPNMFNPVSEKARAVMEAMVTDSYDWFTGLVADRRALDTDVVRTLSDGRVYTGRQALDNKLIDAIGGEDKAKAWLVEEKKLSKKLKIMDWDPETTLAPTSLGVSIMRLLLSGLGLDETARTLEKVLRTERLKLDGLLSVWQPEG